MTPARALLLLLLAAPLAARAQQPVNPIHPLFAPLDAAGRPAASSEAVSAETTCGACHDARYIAAHSAHGDAKTGATCIQCHLEGSRLDAGPAAIDARGLLRRDSIRIGAPRPANCGSCHGLVPDGGAAILLPEELEAAGTTSRSWSLTLGEGAIVSGQRMSDSFLDLESKASLASPWDVHSEKLVGCVACHSARNNPSRTDERQSSLRYLTNDPRRQTVAEFLLRPDHRLAEPDCRTCHDPMQAHAFLPYRERHLQAVACQACHIAAPMAPAAEMVDETVATLDGRPVITWRNLERRPGEALNAALIHPLQPMLVMRAAVGGERRLTPVNLVSHYRWVSRSGGSPIEFSLVRQAFAPGGTWAPSILAALDTDGDGGLSGQELRADTEPKVAAVAARLRALGVVDPAIEGTLEVHPLAHGVTSRERALRDCAACHSENSRLGRDYPIAAYLPGGMPPRPPEGGGRVDLNGSISPAPGGGLVFRHDDRALSDGLHVLGYSRQARTNLFGFVLFVAVALGVSLHGLARVLLRRRSGAAHVSHGHPAGERAYVFGRYERLWHWTMALSGAVLILTGLRVHQSSGPWPLSLPGAVALHNAFAVLLMFNAFLALFYHLATAAIRNFIPHPHGLVGRLIEHAQYQSRGIFYGSPHPRNEQGQKLNPLQQLTYLALLNVLFPLQIGTGLAIWAVGHWPAFAALASGLHVLAPLHNLGAWLFVSFFILHVYLVTTGRTVGEHLRSMVTGYQPVEPEPTGSQGA